MKIKFYRIRPYLVFVFLCVVLGGISSCKKNEVLKFTEKPAVYFSYPAEKDSMTYSFAGNPNGIDTVYLDVSLLGNLLLKDLKYRVNVDEQNSTAIEGLHFKKLDEFYTFSANNVTTKLPIVVYNKDVALETSSVSLVLELEKSDDLDVGYLNKKKLNLIITNQLVKPDYWTILGIYFGEYSKVKHGICIQLQGHDFPITLAEAFAPPYGPSYWMSYGRLAAQYFAENVVFDENDNRIMTWVPL